MTREESTVRALARRGFQNLSQARETVADWPTEWESLLDAVSQTADPDYALGGLNILASGDDTVLPRLAGDETLARQVAALLSGSQALTQHLITHPDVLDRLSEPAQLPDPDALRHTMLSAVAADPTSALPVAGSEEEGLKTAAAADRLRVTYRDELTLIAAHDLTADQPTHVLPQVARALADLADATLEAALAIARAEVGAEATMCRLAVIGLGKTGAQELNYVSDVDVLFVAEPALGDDGEPVSGTDKALSIGTRLAAAMSRVCSAHTGSGTIWQVDAALRPEGKAGALVRTIASHRGYYEKWAKAWEFQAMLKARPVAGDRELGQQFVDMIMPHVWKVGEREGFVAETQAMRRRVISLIPAKEQGREIKLGEGGLRDVEFSVQLLQLVHGRVDERLRTGSTFGGLDALIDGGYVGRADGSEFADAYKLERAMEHRIQLFRLRRTHLLPTEDAELRRLARQLGFRDAEALGEAWRTANRQVLRLHRRLFYSPLLEAVARIPTEGIKLTTTAAEDRLRALGYADPRAALNHLQALTNGMTRQAEIQRQLLPAMLGWFAAGPNPDHGLLAFRQVSEALGKSSWYLRALRDEGAMAERMATLLASSRYAVDLLRRSPASTELLVDEHSLQPRPRAELIDKMAVSARRHDDPAKAIEAVRAVRRHELFRIAAGDILDVLDLEQVGQALSDITDATVDVALSIARRDEDAATRPAMSVIAMGRWGGSEMSYASDVDAMFVLADGADEREQQAALKAVTTLRTLLSRPGPDPALAVDADLRPEGKGGPMVRSLASYESYYQRWSSTWESQALIRADNGAGDRALSRQLLASIDRLRWPEDGLTSSQLAEIRKLKARMEAERLPRAANPKKHLKLGPGGLSDVEWTVQLLQLQHAGRIPALRTQRTLPALRALRANDLIEEADAQVLEQVWKLASRLRNRIMLVRGRASDSLPSDARDAAALAQLMGYGRSGMSHLTADYQRSARQARQVVDRLFYQS